ncbi:hypothetical protein [Pseudonocardia pini]|uniref:hypothetical protein n=1 Tax=Pseudonocardia pini TaxID=2758030 RepID=UPI0015F09FB9|nr:hypothetical protein [Pseudonocardia pini]
MTAAARTDRTCDVCAAPFPKRRNESWTHYALRRFCSRAHAIQGRKPSPKPVLTPTATAGHTWRLVDTAWRPPGFPDRPNTRSAA